MAAAQLGDPDETWQLAADSFNRARSSSHTAFCARQARPSARQRSTRRRMCLKMARQASMEALRGYSSGYIDGCLAATLGHLSSSSSSSRAASSPLLNDTGAVALPSAARASPGRHSSGPCTAAAAAAAGAARGDSSSIAGAATAWRASCEPLQLSSSSNGLATAASLPTAGSPAATEPRIRPDLVKQVALKLAEAVLQAKSRAAAGRLQVPEASSRASPRNAPVLQHTPVELCALLQQLSQHTAAAAPQQLQQQLPPRAEPRHSQPHTAGLWREVPDEQEEQQQALAQLEAAQAAFAALEVASLSAHSSSAGSRASTEEEEELQQHAGHGASSSTTAAGDPGVSSAEPGAGGVAVLQRVLVKLHGLRAAFLHNGGRVGPAEMSRLDNLVSEIAELRQRVACDCGSDHVVAVQLGTLLCELHAWHGSSGKLHLEQGLCRNSSSGGQSQTAAAATPAWRQRSTESQAGLADGEHECGVLSAQSSISFVLRVAPSAAVGGAAVASSEAGLSDGEGAWSSSLGGSRDSSGDGGSLLQ